MHIQNFSLFQCIFLLLSQFLVRIHHKPISPKAPYPASVIFFGDDGLAKCFVKASVVCLKDCPFFTTKLLILIFLNNQNLSTFNNSKDDK